MVHSYFRYPTVERLPVLLEWLKSGELRIPPFQRQIVWTGEQRLALFDTILKGLPLGSLMVWRTTRRVNSRGFQGPFTLAHDPPPDGISQQFLLDGMQRMTTLFAALGPALWRTRGDDVPWSADDRHAPDRTLWRIGYDVAGDDGFVFISKNHAPTILPLDVFLDDSAYDDWRENRKLTRAHKNTARSVRTAFVDYLIPVVPLATDDLTPVTLTFKRLNSGGTQMGDFDMLRALSWDDNFDLDTVFQEHFQPLLEPLGWAEVDKNQLMKICSAAYAIDRNDVERLSKAIGSDRKQIERVPKAIEWAVNEVLGPLGFGGPALLPYANVLIFATQVFFKANEKVSASQTKNLRRWLAEAVVCESLSSGSKPLTLKKLWQYVNEPTRKNAASEGRRERRSENVHFGQARSKMTVAVLAQNLQNAPPDTRWTHAAQTIQLLGASCYLQIFKVYKNREQEGDLHLTAANRLVCEPRDFEKLKRKLMLSSCEPTLLEAHAISDEAHACWIDNDVQGFLDARSKTITALENAWLKKWDSVLKVPQN